MGVGDVLYDIQDFLGQTPESQATGRGAGGNLNPLNRPRKKRVKASELYVMAGGKQEDAQFMGEVAVGESHCRNTATSWTGCCHCIWQIHELHAAKFNMSKEEFKKKLKSDPMFCAEAAVAVMNSQGRGAWEGTKYVGTGRDCSVTIDGKSVNESIVGGVQDVIPDNPLNAVAAVLKPIGDFFKIITDADTWLRVGKVLLGAIILIFAINQLSGGAISGTARKVSRA